jgi:rubrerythrin
VAELMTFGEVLDLAVLKEQESQKLYSSLGKKAIDPAVKEAFQALVKQEQQHQEQFENYRSGKVKKGSLRLEHPCDAGIAEHFAKPRPKAAMSLRDTFLYAADREKASHEFYLKLAAMHEAGETRSLLEKLASQELEHKVIVESLFNEVAFPQTDGG